MQQARCLGFVFSNDLCKDILGVQLHTFLQADKKYDPTPRSNPKSNQPLYRSLLVLISNTTAQVISCETSQNKKQQLSQN